MYTFLLIIHFLACFLLVVAILLQSGKGSAAGIFGSSGGGDGMMNAPATASFISRFTMALAVLIAITSISLTVLVSKGTSKSIMDSSVAPVQAEETK